MTTEEIANYHFSLAQSNTSDKPNEEEEEKAEDPLLLGKD